MMIVVKRFLIIFYIMISTTLVQSLERSDSFVLSLMWPNAYCNRLNFTCKQPVPQQFIIHRFHFYKSNVTSAASKWSFPSKTEVKSWNFTKRLESFWPGLEAGKENYYVWKTAYYKGRAWHYVPAEAYFYLAVKYANKYINVYDKLKKSGTVIPRNQPYEAIFLRNKVGEALNILPMVYCNENIGSKTQLVSLRICMNYEGITYECRFPFRNCDRLLGVIENQEIKMLSAIIFATEATVHL